MSDVEHFALITLLTAAALVAAVVSNRISERTRIPAPALFLVAAAVASDVVPTLGEVSVTTVQRVVTIALAVILFDGGMQIGWRRFREAAGPVLWVGVAGTFVTAAALAVLAMCCSAWSGGRRCWSARRWPHRPGGGVLGAGPPGDRRA